MIGLINNKGMAVKSLMSATCGSKQNDFSCPKVGYENNIIFLVILQFLHEVESKFDSTTLMSQTLIGSTLSC